MPILTKPAMYGGLLLQSDHYHRVADLCFRHLAGASARYNDRQNHAWILKITNDDPEYGRSRYLKSLAIYQFNQSEEYSQSIATVLFAHIWLLSAANYYRLSCKHKIPHDAPWLGCDPIEKTFSPQHIAQELKLPEFVVQQAEIIHRMRNTITHLVETDKKTEPIDKLDFPMAFRLVKTTWIIYLALLRHYGVKPDPGSWVIQTKKYELPRVM